MLLGSLLTSAASARKIEAELRDVYGPESGAVDEVLKSGDEAHVFAGQFQGQAAVYKRLMTPDAAQKLAETELELRFLSAALAEGPARVAPFLGVLPDTGCLILGRAPGARVSLALKTEDRAERSRVMALCGQWLADVAALRQEIRPFWSRKMVRKLSGGLPETSPQAALLIGDTLARMEALGLPHRRKPLTHAMAHGDFAPVNLSVEGDTVWAYDIQGGHVLPLARMAARFLTAACLYWPGLPGPLGLDAEDLAAFDITRILPPEEQGEIFAFFVAEQMLRRISSENRKGEARETALTRLQALHDQLPPVEGVT
ncbi:hypothetical protein [Shimia sediminis]|uniref:hypothetical protein n=1 Tax=Shimia sediminis TaxID=2497945 RepID=UPI000F8C82E3|nr:hypothetical protein [Shimia sediminis]